MKRILMMLFMAFLVFAQVAVAQDKGDKKNSRKQARLERKAEEARKRQQMKNVLVDLVEDKNFVLEADALYDRRMNRYNVTANNFIMVHEDQVVLQTSFPGRMGYNGMGGLTVEGTLTDYEVKTGKDQKPIRVTAQMSSAALGHSTIYFDISADGTARATFTDNWGNRITFSGPVQNAAASRVYKGMNVI